MTRGDRHFALYCAAILSRAVSREHYGDLFHLALEDADQALVAWEDHQVPAATPITSPITPAPPAAPE